MANASLCPFIVQTGVNIDEDLDHTDGETTSDTGDEDEGILEMAAYYKELERSRNELYTVPAEKIAELNERADMRALTKAFLKVRKGTRLQSEGLEVINNVVARRPSLGALAKIMAPFNSLSSAGQYAGTTARGVFPQVSAEGEGQVHPAPNKIGEKQFQCRTCQEVFPSYGGCDTHTRREHTKVKVGPCNVCHVFTTYAVDSFRRHQANCGKQQPRRVATKKIPSAALGKAPSDDGDADGEEEEPVAEKCKEKKRKRSSERRKKAKKAKKSDDE